MLKHLIASVAAVGITALVCGAELRAEDRAAATQPATKPVVPKPLSKNVEKGLQWLIARQLPGGGWAQGDESAQMGQGMNALKATPNVADTCMATMALIRSGSTPAKGEFAPNILKALDYVCSEVERSDDKSLWVTTTKGTRVQSKLGQYIDTFAAALLLAEVRNDMPDEVWRKRAVAALDKVMDKIEKNQKPDGTFASDGWAPALAQGMASQAINKAADMGAKVDEKVRQRAEQHAVSNFDAKSGKVGAGGSAGVELYAASSNLKALDASNVANTGRLSEMQKELEQLKVQADSAPATTAPAIRQKIAQTEQRLQQMSEVRGTVQAAQAAIINRLDDKQFISGFGSNGGEEFLSYLNIGESLVAKGGDAWDKWDKSMTENLNRIQSEDGSWTGHHCITGRTFCTSSALLVLMVDRSNSVTNVSDKIRKQ